jgi:hypothetical protein
LAVDRFNPAAYVAIRDVDGEVSISTRPATPLMNTAIVGDPVISMVAPTPLPSMTMDLATVTGPYSPASIARMIPVLVLA